MRKEDVRYWDAIAAQDDAAVRDALAGLRSEKAFDESGRVDASHFVLPFVSSDDDVLDVGCGIGRLLKWVAPHCSEAIGIDVSGGLLQIARKHLSRLPNVRLKRLPRSLAFPMETGSIDFAYYYRVSVHVDREDNLRILQELRRCLRPRGRALVQFSLIEHPENRKELSRWARERDEEDLGLSYLTESEARIFLDLAKLHPQIRLFVPGEFAVIVTKRDDRVLGEAPLVSVRACAERHTAGSQVLALAAVLVEAQEFAREQVDGQVVFREALRGHLARHLSPRGRIPLDTNGMAVSSRSAPRRARIARWLRSLILLLAASSVDLRGLDMC